MVGGRGESFFMSSLVLVFFYFFHVCGSKMVWDWVVNFFACVSICFTGSISLYVAQVPFFLSSICWVGCVKTAV